MNTATILLLISLLTKQVNLLEQELAQQQAVVATSTYVAPIYNPPVTQNPTGQPVLGDVQTSTPESCTITAQTEGSSSTPQTYITWTLDGLPTSTIGNVMGVMYNGNETSTYEHVMNLINQPTGPFPNQNTTLSGRWYQSLTADFGDATCSVTPEPQPY